MNERMMNSISKLYYYLSAHKNVVVSISGGSDSDIVLDLCERVKNSLTDTNIYYCFVNTGIEFQATLKHIDYLKSKYNVNITELKGEPIPLVIKKHGYPVLSKVKSKHINAYMRNIKYAKEMYEANGKYKNSVFSFDEKMKKTIEYAKAHNITINNKCCTYSKKKPLSDFEKTVDCDLIITGERQCEGGIRKFSNKSCFKQGGNKTLDKYMPLWYWSDTDKTEYEKEFDIIHSDCYTIYGMKRTGCVGCPYSLTIYDDLETIRKYEPKLYKMCINVFDKSYEMIETLNLRKKTY